MSDAALRFERVAVALSGRPVLRAIDLELRPGEVTALVGRNGAGKTTLLRLATRVLAPDTGRVSVGGAAAETLSRRELARRVAIVPQEASVPFPFRALEVVLMGRSPHLGALGFESAHDLELARAAMARVGIAEFEDRSILSLSGGERQLVLVARALAQQSDVLLFDEATAFLDLRHRALVLELAREFASDGRRAALVVSHDLSLAARYCDRVALLDRGEILAFGRPDEVFEREALQRAFGLEVEVLTASDGAPVVVPRTTGRC